MKNMTLGKRIAIAFGSLILLAALLGGMGYYGAVKNSAAIREIGTVRLPGVQSLQAAKLGMSQVIEVQMALLQADLNSAERQHELDSVAKTREE